MADLAFELCKFPDCGRPVKCKATGYCNSHQIQHTRGESLRPIRKVSRGPQRFCIFPGCGRPVAAKDYCDSHYKQHQKGMTLAVLAPRKPRQIMNIAELALREYKEVPVAGLQLVHECQDCGALVGDRIIHDTWHGHPPSARISGELGRSPVPIGLMGEREHQALEMIAGGASHMAVAQRFGVGLTTVRRMVKRSRAEHAPRD